MSFLTKQNSFSIITNSKEYGFGQSILNDGQLVFHTPPYSLQPVSLQDCYDTIGKMNIRVSKHDPEPKSPNTQHTKDPMGNSNISPIDKNDRQSNITDIRTKDAIGSPIMFEKRPRKYSGPAM